jgi:hypothetical protein
VRALAFISLLVLASCSGPTAEPVDDRPLGIAADVQAAAESCGVPEWELADVFVFDGPQTDEPHLVYKIKSLPSEEVQVAKGRAWDRTSRIEKIDWCLESHFAEQGVRVPMIGASLRVECQGSACDDFESDPQ